MTRFRLLLFFILCTATSFAQFRDAGMWSDFTLSANYKKHWQFSISPEVRLNENLSNVGRAFTDVGAQYKFSKEVFATATYRGGVADEGDIYGVRQRIQLGLGYKRKFGDFTITYQPRWQLAVQFVSSESDADFITTLRNKVQVKYSVMKKLDVSTSFELFNNTSNYQQFVLQNWRWTAALSRDINKHSTVSAGYLIQKNITASPQRLDYVFLLSYEWNIDLGKKKKKQQEEPKEANK